MTLEDLTKMIEEKRNKNEEKIVFTYYEMRVKQNLSPEELEKVLELITNYLVNNGYNIYREKEEYEYQGRTKKVESNEVLVAIKNKKGSNIDKK